MKAKHYSILWYHRLKKDETSVTYHDHEFMIMPIMENWNESMRTIFLEAVYLKWTASKYYFCCISLNCAWILRRIARPVAQHPSLRHRVRSWRSEERREGRRKGRAIYNSMTIYRRQMKLLFWIHRDRQAVCCRRTEEVTTRRTYVTLRIMNFFRMLLGDEGTGGSELWRLCPH